MKKNLRIRVIWLFGIIAVVILLCCIFLFYSLFMFKSIRNQETRENLNNAVTIQDALDDTWDSALTHALPLANSSVSKQLEGAGTAKDFRSQQAQALFVDMRNAVLYDATLEDIGLYYPKADYIVGSMGIKSSRNYWALTYGANQNVSYMQWTELIYCQSQSGFFTVEGKEATELYYRFCFEGDNGRVLVIRFSRDGIAQRLQWLHNNATDSFSAVLLEGSLYASCGDLDAVLRDELAVTPKKSYFSTRLNASIEGMEYLSLAKKTSVFRLSSTSLMVAALLLILAVCMCMVMIRWIVRQHIQPLEKIASKVVRGNSGKNEIQIINAAFEALLIEQHSLEALYDQQQTIIARAFMDELLRQDLSEQKNLEDVAASFGYSMENAYYCMIARITSPGQTEEATAAFVKSQNDIADGNTCIWWTRKHGLDFFLANYDEGGTYTPADLRSQLAAVSDPDTKIAQSQSTDSLHAVKELYQQCYEALGCKQLFVTQEESNAPAGADNTNPVFEQFQQLVIGGNIPEAQKLVKNLFEQFVDDQDPLRHNTKNYLLIHFLLPYSPADAHDLLAQLPQKRDAASWMALMRSILDSCAFAHEDPSQEPENDIAARIRKLIDRQYTNPLLDLHMLSSQVNLSQSYISRLFKLKYNISVAQYINSVRIRKAKELILLGNDSIKAISIKVGFAGDSQFIRAYKRIEGETPGNFRSANTQLQSPGGNE